MVIFLVEQTIDDIPIQPVSGQEFNGEAGLIG